MKFALLLLLIFATWGLALGIAPWAAKWGEAGLFGALCLGASGSIIACFLA